MITNISIAIILALIIVLLTYQGDEHNDTKAI